MILRIIVLLVVAVLAVAPQAYAAIGGGMGADSNAQVSGAFNSSTGQSGTFAIDCSGPNCSGTIRNNGSNGSVTVATPEPLAALAAGFGLLGVRYLRRRR